jgi:hypothetical protein
LPHFQFDYFAYVVRMNVYIAAEGYTLPGKFVVKEICCMFVNEEYNHYLLKPPKDCYLSDIDKRTIRYTTRNLNNLAYHDGDFPYENMHEIFERYREYRVYTYSDVTLKLLQNFLPTSVITNTQEMGLRLPSTLPNPRCCRQHTNFRFCAKAKAIAVKNFIES